MKMGQSDMNNAFFDRYKEAVKQDREVTRQMVANGELSEDEADFRDDIRKDEILRDMMEVEE